MGFCDAEFLSQCLCSPSSSVAPNPLLYPLFPSPSFHTWIYTETGWRVKQPTHSFTHTPHPLLSIYPIPLSPPTTLPLGLVFFVTHFFPSAHLGLSFPLYIATTRVEKRFSREYNGKGTKVTWEGKGPSFLLIFCENEK
jgi:hypothetical protein